MLAKEADLIKVNSKRGKCDVGGLNGSDCN